MSLGYISDELSDLAATMDSRHDEPLEQKSNATAPSAEVPDQNDRLMSDGLGD